MADRHIFATGGWRMQTPAILFLSNHTLIAFEQRGGQMYERCRFPTDARYVDAYCEFIEALRYTPTSVLVDIVAEEFAADSLPRVGGSDRALVLGRALERYFARTAYRTSRVMGRSPDVKGRNRVLLAGLTNSDLVARWVTPLVERGVPLRGIYSVPFVQQRLVRGLRMHTGNRLLVSIQDHSALRLSLFTNGQLASSRLALIDADDHNNLAEYIGDQIARSRNYFTRGHLLGFADTLYAEVVSSPTLRDALAGLEMEPRVELGLHTPADLTRRLPRGARLVDADRAELLYASALVNDGQVANYAREVELRSFSALRSAGQISTGALAASVLCVTAAAWQIGAGVAVVAQKPYVNHRVAAANDMLASERRLAHRPGYAFTDLQEARLLAEHLRERAVSPFAVTDIVSVALVDQPAIEIDELKWGEPEPASAGQVPVVRPSDGTLELTAGGRVVSFEGEVPGAFARIEAFMDALRTDPRVLDVQAVRMPLNVDTNDSLSGEVERLARSATVEFELLLQIEPHPAAAPQDDPQRLPGATVALR